MALLDLYASQGETVVPLCERYKDDLLAGRLSGRPDPYLYLIETLRAFYAPPAEQMHKRLIEQSFLMRHIAATQAPPARNDERGREFHALAGSWGWREEEIEAVETFHRWNSHEIETLRTSVVSFLLETCRRIRKRTMEAGARISERDLTVVGKKLVGFFKHEDGKIPYEFTMMAPRDIASIEIDEHRGRDARHLGWAVTLKTRDHHRMLQHLSREVPNPLIACAWCSLNRFYRNRQQIKIAGRTSLTVKQATELIRALTQFFPLDEADALNIDELLAPRFITHAYLIPSGDRPDSSAALSGICVLYRNSMGELFFETMSGPNTIEWLFKKFFLEKTTRQYLPRLIWAVHMSRGDIESTRMLSERLEKQVREFLEGVSVIGRS
jgi:adenylate cyclase class 1